MRVGHDSQQLRKKIATLVIFASVVATPMVCAALANTFHVPALTGPVVDDADVLDQGVRAQLESGIRKLRDQGGSQVTVLTVPSLAGLEIEQASIQVTDAWKLGGAKSDNGVLLLIAPTEHKVRIEVGQGLEGQLTDAFSNRIIQGVILPNFKRGDYSQGTLQGVAAIIHYTDPAVDVNSLFNGGMPRLDERSGPSRKLPLWVFVVGFFVLITLLRRGGGGGGGRMSPWGAGALGYGLGRLGGGGFGGGGGGGGSWGGGGGGFSGGGASGGW